jgi:hypothetical protein
MNCVNATSTYHHMIPRETFQEERNSGIYFMLLVINSLKHFMVTMLSEDIHPQNINLQFLITSCSKCMFLLNYFTF